MRSTLPALFLVFTASPAVAQSNTALMANDHYTRSHDYDLVHQRIAVSDFNWDSTSFEGSVTTTLVALRPGLDSIILDEGAELRNTAIRDRRGAALRSDRHGDTLVVFPAAALPFGDSLTFTVAYHGKVVNGQGLTYITQDGLPRRPRQIWSQGEDHNNHYWFPTFDFPSDKMTWEMVATVPRGSMAVSNGRLVSDKASGATRTLTWSQEQPASSYLVSLIVAPLARIHDSWHGIPVDYYVYHEDSLLAWPLFHITPDMIDTYSRLTGVNYPWAKYAQTTVADFFGGMENVSATTLLEPLPDAAAYQDRPWYRWILIPHELAHQWFGNYVTTENWANTWLNEGFAEFMPGQYWGAKLGAHAEQDYYAEEYRQYVETDGARSMPLASLGSNNIYPKGALVLEMLKQYLGPQRFWASIHTFLIRHAFGVATTEDLRQAFLATTGENLDRFWSEWMYQAGYPQLEVAASYDSAAHVLALTIKQMQLDTLKPDSTGLRFTTPPVFHLPLLVRVGTDEGDVTQRVDLDARQQTVTIPNVMTPPTMVIFDDSNAVLKSLRFDQPTAWLATQLRRDRNLWNRGWVIGQLAARKNAADAAAALAEAATDADYYLTRQQAVEVLGGFSAASALPAVATALHDTSSAVRAAAVGALGQIGGADATALAWEAFNNDPSSLVRAAAVAAIGRADSAHTGEIITRALAQTSYDDAIRHAALGLIVTAMDTTRLGMVDSLMETRRDAAFVLAALGARGSTHALDLLAQHLDDERATVRGWALQAFEFALPHKLGLEGLRAAMGGLTHPDAQRAVRAAIQHMSTSSAGQ
jgi:aminopeptidase N